MLGQAADLDLSVPRKVRLAVVEGDAEVGRLRAPAFPVARHDLLGVAHGGLRDALLFAFAVGELLGRFLRGEARSIHGAGEVGVDPREQVMELALDRIGVHRRARRPLLGASGKARQARFALRQLRFLARDGALCELLLDFCLLDRSVSGFAAGVRLLALLRC